MTGADQGTTEARLAKGTITKALAGFYYVDTEEGEYVCRARGIMRKSGESPLVGDEVIIGIQDEEEGIVDEILPRKNSFVRPPIANIDIFVAVIAVAKPSFNPEILDRFIVMAEAANVDAIICVNKSDLKGNTIDKVKEIYSPYYTVITTSAKTREGMDVLKEEIRGKRVAFAGPSGVGKSSLIMDLLGDVSPSKELKKATNTPLEVGEVSKKTGRGRHTTRHIEIFSTEFGAEIFDTPGYTSFDGVVPEEEAIASYFPEIFKHAEGCRFDNCRHLNEPGCAVKDAFEEGIIAETRFATYRKMIDDARESAKDYSTK